MQYITGLLVGRAYALANGTLSADDGRDPAELCDLARGDRMAIVLAQARYREFLAGPSPSVGDRRALKLLDAALERFDALRCA